MRAWQEVGSFSVLFWDGDSGDETFVATDIGFGMVNEVAVFSYVASSSVEDEGANWHLIKGNNFSVSESGAAVGE